MSMVDILLAVYNGEEYLKEQLESIAGQTYTDWRLVIRDDRSTDGSVAVAEAFRAKYPQKQIELYINEQPTGSAKMNFMRLLGDAKADYVMFCDQDDVWLPKKIEYTLKMMRRCEKKHNSKTVPVLVHGDLCVVDEKLNTIALSMRKYQKLPLSSDVNQLLIQNNVTGCTVMINKPLLEMMKKVTNTHDVVMHDYWAALIAAVFGEISFIRQPLIKYRQHGNNSVGAMNAAGVKYLYTRFRAGKSQFRERTKETMIQAGAFCTAYSDELKDNYYKNLIQKYAELENSAKFHKIQFYISNNVMKYGIIRKIMQLIWS